MQTHGGDHLHTGENSDGSGGSIGLCQNVMGGVHPVDHPLGGRHIQARLDGKEHWREAVGFIDIICGSGNVFGLFLKTWPRAENKANIVSIGGDAPTVQDSVDDIRGSGGQAHCGIRRQGNLRLCHPQNLQFLQRVGVPQGDGVHRAVHHPGGPGPVSIVSDGADATAIHDDRASIVFGGCQGPQIEPQGAVRSDILHEGTAAVDEELRPLEIVDRFPDVEGVKGVDPVGLTGFHGIAGKNLEGEIRINGPKLCEDGQQDGVVSGVAPAIGAADDHPVSAVFLIAENGIIDFQLPLNGGLYREFPFCLFI